MARRAVSELILTGCLILALGGVGRLLTPSGVESGGLSAPPPRGWFLVLGLGNERAASDIAWLQAVQLLGQGRYQSRGYPFLELWLELVVDLDPSATAAYYTASAFLSADPARANRVDAMLQRGELARPDDFSISMARGFTAYFGSQDLAAAATHFDTAAGKPRAPAYLRSFSRRLRTIAGDCERLPELLPLIRTNVGTPTPTARTLLVSCISRKIELGAATFRLKHGRDASVDELVETGTIAPPPSPADECWTLEDGKARLGPCRGSP
jgi:hypothetical protein